MTHEELTKKAKQAASVEELMELAKNENVELSVESARTIFAQLHSEGEIADDELDSVAGGGCGGAPEYTLPRYSVGQTIAVDSFRKCKACGCNLGVIYNVFRMWCDDNACEYLYRVNCKSCGNAGEAYEKRHKCSSLYEKSDIIGRVG